MNQFLSKLYIPISSFVFFITCFSSCTTVKNYPPNKPFVYKTNIEIEGKFSTDERKELKSQLQNQLHDSLEVRSVQKALFFRQMLNPPAYDSVNADKSVIFMRALLNSLGYYRDTITYDTVVRTREGQLRTTVNFHVNPGKLIHLDSVWYTMGSDTLQSITERAKPEALVKKGEPFSKSLITSELNRLVDLYRNNGYLRFTFDEMVALWDTVGLALLRPTIDPIEQAQQLQELQRRRQNPTADLEILLRDNEDSARLTRYYNGNVTVYADLTSDTAEYNRNETIINGIKVVSYYNLFKPQRVAENVYLRKGLLYDQRRYLRTLNRFNSLGAWRLVSIDQLPRPFTDTVDFVIKLTPAKKYLFNASVEGSKNWGYNPLSEGNLLGIGLNVGLQNRNFAKAANQANTNLRYGVELNTEGNFFQTQQITLGHSILFPRLMPPFKFIPENRRDNFKTVFSLNISNTNRYEFYNLTTVNLAWGYDYNRRNKLASLRFPNIEYTYLLRRALLKTLIDSNKSYENIFNDGLVSSIIGTYTVSGARKNITNQKRLSIEIPDPVTPFIRSPFLDSNLYRFVKLDGEFKQTHKIRRKEFAWRAFVGVGYELPSSHHKHNDYMPFYRQYYAGGANSMRAWGLRKLGPGSTIKSFERTVAPDRTGDIQIELNAEYRFYLADIQGILLNSALFTDIGNVWFLRKNPDFPNGEFQFNRLWNDIAIGLGTGIRVDFGFLKVRVDYAYKVKNPSPDKAEDFSQNKWFYNWKPLNGQLQLGVNYPF